MKRYRPEDVYDHLVARHMIPTSRETLYLVILTEDGEPETSYKLAHGERHSVRVVEEAIFLLSKGRPFALAHTHTSGSLEPSRSDLAWTSGFRDRVGARFRDHLVITPDGFGSVV